MHLEFLIQERNQKLKYATAWIFLVILVLFAAFPARAQTIFSGRVVNVADGDTITVLVPDNQQVKIRLYGIDCPEKSQAFGQRAKEFTADWVAGKNVRVEVMDIDRYGRIVGLVKTDDGHIINRELLINGLAWVYTHYCKESFCEEWERDERRAQRRQIGLWVDKDPIEPWEWRKMNRR